MAEVTAEAEDDAKEAADAMEEVQRITHDPEAESCSSLDDLGKAPLKTEAFAHYCESRCSHSVSFSELCYNFSQLIRA